MGVKEKVSSASDFPTIVRDDVRDVVVIDPFVKGAVGNCITLVSKFTLLQLSW